MILRPPIATRTDTPVTTRRSSDLRWRAQPRLRVRDHRGADQRADDRDQWIDQRCQGDQADTAGGGNLGRGVARAARLAAFSRVGLCALRARSRQRHARLEIGRASCRKSVSVRVNLGGRRIIKKKKIIQLTTMYKQQINL